MTHVTDAVARVTTDKNIGDSQAAIPMVDSVLRFHQQHEAPETADGEGGANVLVSVVMPCLNEARTLAACIEQAHAGCRSALAMRNHSGDVAGSAVGPCYEIIIADNGSTDGSQAIATEHGAKVVSIEQKGYGAALMCGIAAARGKYVVMGDSDCSYDFGEVPRFLDKLEEGYDLVMGNRFAGGIMPGAMPWHHRYIGNPVLSGIGRLLYRTPCKDWHCGLRAFDREKIQDLHLSCTGMEFASEMVVRASQSHLQMTEISTALRPDGRDRPPHLRSLRDGCRHLIVLIGSSANSILWKRILGLTVLLISALVLWAGLYHIPSDIKNAAEDRVELLEHDFGAIRTGSENRCTLKLKNTSDFDWTVERVQTSCGCTVASITPSKILPGETADVAVVYSAPRQGRAESRDLKIVFFESRAPDIRVRVKALVTEEIEIVPREMRFAAKSVEKFKAERLIIKNYGALEWTNLSCVNAPAWISASTKLLDADWQANGATQVWAVDIHVAPTEPVYGHQSLALQFQATDLDDSLIEVGDVACSVDLEPGFRVNPSRLVFVQDSNKSSSARLSIILDNPVDPDALKVNHQFGESLSCSWYRVHAENWNLECLLDKDAFSVVNTKDKVLGIAVEGRTLFIPIVTIQLSGESANEK